MQFVISFFTGGIMRYGGSPRARMRLYLSLFVDYLERQSPRFDKWSFWMGVGFGTIAIVATYLHHLLPRDSLTEDFITIIATGIRTLHTGIHLPLADLMTYAAGPFLLLGIISWLARRIVHKGGAKSL